MRLAKQLALWLAVAALLAWPADWAIWSLRGSPTAQVEVTRFVVAPLKGGKEEYYPDGTTQATCSQSLFTNAGQSPCWQLQRHKVIYDR